MELTECAEMILPGIFSTGDKDNAFPRSQFQTCLRRAHVKMLNTCSVTQLLQHFGSLAFHRERNFNLGFNLRIMTIIQVHLIGM